MEKVKKYTFHINGIPVDSLRNFPLTNSELEIQKFDYGLCTHGAVDIMLTLQDFRIKSLNMEHVSCLK